MKALDYFFPEVGVGGYSRVDGTIEFYGRINSIIDHDSVVLDFGAGRGQGPVDDPVSYRRNLRTLKGKCKCVIGVDLDEAVLENPFLDKALVLEARGQIPLADSSVDLILSDAVFEHIADPVFFTAELDRVLRPGGVICARTPNRWGYIGIGTNLVPNKWHVRWLERLQPHRKPEDVFPTVYTLNTKRALGTHFPKSKYRNVMYGYSGEPAYFAQSKILWAFMLLVFRLTPDFFSPIWMIFLQKRVD